MNCILYQIWSGSTGTAGDLIYKPGVKMKINSTEYEVSVNPPLVDNVKIAGPIMTNSLVYPLKLKVNKVFLNNANTASLMRISSDVISDTYTARLD